MEAYAARAQEVAAALGKLSGVMIVPDPPHTNSFQVYLPAPCQALQKGVEHLAETEHMWLFNTLKETTFPSLTLGEIVIGDATEQWTTEEIVSAMKTLLTSVDTRIRIVRLFEGVGGVS